MKAAISIICLSLFFMATMVFFTHYPFLTGTLLLDFLLGTFIVIAILGNMGLMLWMAKECADLMD